MKENLKFFGSVVVGERGQIVIPAEARESMNISPGDKLLVLSGPEGRMLVVAKAEFMLEMFNKFMSQMPQLEKMIEPGGEPGE